MKRGTKKTSANARMMAINAIEEAASNLEKANKQYDEANEAFMQSVRDKRDAETALRAALAELRQTSKK